MGHYFLDTQYYGFSASQRIYHKKCRHLTICDNNNFREHFSPVLNYRINLQYIIHTMSIIMNPESIPEQGQTVHRGKILNRKKRVLLMVFMLDVCSIHYAQPWSKSGLSIC